MQKGAVIVDLAADSGGNCELTEPGRIVAKDGVTDHRHHQPVPPPSRFTPARSMPTTVVNLLKLILTKEGELKIDTADEVIAGVLLTHGGQIVHPRLKELMAHA